MSKLTILDSVWFTELGGVKLIGIVRCDNGFEIKYYIGTGDGFSKDADSLKISQHGARYPTHAGDVLFGINHVKA